MRRIAPKEKEIKKDKEEEKKVEAKFKVSSLMGMFKREESPRFED